MIGCVSPAVDEGMMSLAIPLRGMCGAVGLAVLAALPTVSPNAAGEKKSAVVPPSAHTLRTTTTSETIETGRY
jgi:hypothetical protein